MFGVRVNIVCTSVSVVETQSGEVDVEEGAGDNNEGDRVALKQGTESGDTLGASLSCAEDLGRVPVDVRQRWDWSGNWNLECCSLSRCSLSFSLRSLEGNLTVSGSGESCLGLVGGAGESCLGLVGGAGESCLDLAGRVGSLGVLGGAGDIPE